MRGRPLVVLAILAAGCDSSTAPPPMAVRIEAVTATIVKGTVGTEVTPAPAVRATGEEGAPVAGVAISFEVKGGGGTIAHSAVKTNADGVAAVGNWILGPAPGNHTVIARTAGLADVVFTAIAEAGPAARIFRLGGDDQLAEGRERLPRPLHARVADAWGNPIAGATVTFKVIAGGGSIENGVAVSGLDGIAVSGAWTLGHEAGAQRAMAESGNAQGVFSAYAFVPPAGWQGRLAFVSGSEKDAEIYVADANGLQRLTTNSASDYAPAWSPDGNQIAFVSDRDGASKIYVMAADGSNVTRRTRGPYDWAPAWHPNGSTIAFSAAMNDEEAQIAVLRTANDSIVFLTDVRGYAAGASWSPDGRKLAFVINRFDFELQKIYTMNADGSEQALLAKMFDVFPSVGFYMHPTWSPDGNSIAFVYSTSRDDLRFKVAVMSPDGTFIKDLAPAGDLAWLEVVYPGSLTWSPDGRGIAYTSVGCEPPSGGNCDVRSVNYVSLDGKQQFRIVTKAHSPSWTR